jgi:glycosyltransferase involved in cell wall biosynthesis
MAIWNVCLTHHPRYAGLHRAVEDFARACEGPILSFDATADTLHAISEDRDHPLYVIGCKAWPSDGPYWLNRGQRDQAELLLQDADGVIVHSLFRAHCSFVAQWSRTHRRPFWVVPHGCLDPWGLSQRRWVKHLWLATAGRRVFRECRGVFLSTSREAEKAAAWLGSAEQIITPWPVPKPDVSREDVLKTAFRESLGIPPHAVVLLFIGRLHSMKRPRELIDIFRRVVKAEGSDAHLVLIGMDGDMTAAMLQDYAGNPASSHVHLAGPRYGDDLTAGMADADCYVSLSHRENFSYAAADALAAGLPVILSEGHDIAHDLPLAGPRDGSCGWMTTQTPDRSAEQAIRECLTTPREKLGAMGQTAAQWAEVHLRPELFKSSVAAACTHV